MKLMGMIWLAYLIARTDLSRSPLNEGEDCKFSMVQDLHLLDRHALGIDNTLRLGAGQLWLQVGHLFAAHTGKYPLYCSLDANHAAPNAIPSAAIVL